jgi:hypothetical protein
MKENSAQDTHISGEISESGILKVDSSTGTFPLSLFNNELIDFILNYFKSLKLDFLYLLNSKNFFSKPYLFLIREKV